MKFCTDEVTELRVYGRNVVFRARQLPFDRYSSFLVSHYIAQPAAVAERKTNTRRLYFSAPAISGYRHHIPELDASYVVLQPQRPLRLLRRLHRRGGHRRRRRPRFSRRHHRRRPAGASSGIGLETARVLALRSVHVVMAVRNVAAGLKASEAIRAEIAGAKVHVLELDLSSMDSVRRFASEFDSLNLPLNILINNAGILAKNCTRSIDGLELHFATNHIGHFLLTNLLLENMKNASRESGVEGRIINVSSSGHIITYPEGICFDKVKDPSRFWTYIAYGQSKLANILHSIELARILKGDDVNILANAIHPGVVGTNLFKHRASANAVVNSIGRIVRKTVEQGAATTCYVALHPQVTGISGKYFSNCNLETPSSQASNSELAKKLWEFSTKVVSS